MTPPITFATVVQFEGPESQHIYNNVSMQHQEEAEEQRISKDITGRSTFADEAVNAQQSCQFGRPQPNEVLLQSHISQRALRAEPIGLPDRDNLPGVRSAMQFSDTIDRLKDSIIDEIRRDVYNLGRRLEEPLSPQRSMLQTFPNELKKSRVETQEFYTPDPSWIELHGVRQSAAYEIIFIKHLGQPNFLNLIARLIQKNQVSVEDVTNELGKIATNNDPALFENPWDYDSLICLLMEQYNINVYFNDLLKNCSRFDLLLFGMTNNFVMAREALKQLSAQYLVAQETYKTITSRNGASQSMGQITYLFAKMFNMSNCDIMDKLDKALAKRPFVYISMSVLHVLGKEGDKFALRLLSKKARYDPFAAHIVKNLSNQK